MLQRFFGRDELGDDDNGRYQPDLRHAGKVSGVVDKLLLCMDEDAAGSVRWTSGANPVKWAEVVQPPASRKAGKQKPDVTDFWRAGVDLREWLQPYLKAAVPELVRRDRKDNGAFVSCGSGMGDGWTLLVASSRWEALTAEEQERHQPSGTSGR